MIYANKMNNVQMSALISFLFSKNGLFLCMTFGVDLSYGHKIKREHYNSSQCRRERVIDV